MKNKKRVSIVLIGLGLIFMLLVFRNEQVRVTTYNSELKIKTDSLFLELEKQDSLITRINILEDSLLKSKTDTLIKIKKVYETKANNIINLPIDGQVELLTKYLTKDTINW